ncbi:MAG: hypothetical protein V7K14_03520 [Nostoc sp.]|uniref:hypothetical protein n=1 Tax=Nostoc sp. TaxID=1180 RepID=UPI002FF7D1F0
MPNAQCPMPNTQCPMPNTSLREASPTTSLPDAVRVRSVQVPNLPLYRNIRCL